MSTVPAISAHRGGSEDGTAGTYEAYQAALAAGAEYVEFDVRQTRDGIMVACHDGRAGWCRAVRSLRYSELCRLRGHEVPTVPEVMRMLSGRAAGHIDLKDPGCADSVTLLGLELLKPAGMIVTTGDTGVLTELKRRFPEAPTGLTISGGHRISASARRRRRSGELLVASGAVDWAVLNHRLANSEVLAGYRHLGIKTMVWTVSTDSDLVRWMSTPGVDALVTDRPARALSLRSSLSPRRPCPLHPLPRSPIYPG